VSALEKRVAELEAVLNGVEALSELPTEE
jgi:hypothetical protein